MIEEGKYKTGMQQENTESASCIWCFEVCFHFAGPE